MASRQMQYYTQSVPRTTRQASNSGARAHLQQIASTFKSSSVKSTPCGGCASGTKKNCCGH